MSEERLQEIKDSVNFQREILKAHNMGTLCVDEEQELIEEIERLNNIINEFNSSYSKIIKECEEMINDRYYMNENAIKYHANRIRDIAKYYIEEPKWQELKGSGNNEQI